MEQINCKGCIHKTIKKQYVDMNNGSVFDNGYNEQFTVCSNENAPLYKQRVSKTTKSNCTLKIHLKYENKTTQWL